MFYISISNTMWRKVRIQIRFRLDIFRRVYLRRFVIISIILLSIGIHGLVVTGSVEKLIGSLLGMLILFISFFFADMHDRETNSKPNNPVGQMIDISIGQDEEYQSILKDEQEEIKRKKRSKLLKNILDG